MMNRRLWFVALVVLIVAVVLPLSGCSDDDDGMLGAPAANPAFNGTFSGNVVVNTPTGPVADTITMVLSVGSPMEGTILFEILGFVGIIEGDANGDQATFTITITGPCPGNLEGTMVIVVNVDGATIDIDASGIDCNGDIDFAGDADQVETCDDSVDNDGDELIDCDDPDCVDDPNCADPGKCGDGTQDPGEQCDDNNTTACDGCSDTCQTETGLVCGDNILNRACGEECDDGNTTPGDGCDDMCMSEGGCAGAAAADPNLIDCADAPLGGCSFDVQSNYLPTDDPSFTCETVCTTLGLSCVDSFDGDFGCCHGCAGAAGAQLCSTQFLMIVGGQPDMHCHCGP